MPLFLKCVFLLALTAASALAAGTPPVHTSAWFEPLDARRSRWVVRAPSNEAELSAGMLKLAARSRDVLNVRLIGASKSAVVRGEQPLAAHSFYFLGRDPMKWRGAVPHFSRARAVGVYPGIDAVYYQGPQGLEADFIVSPGADSARIQLQFEDRRITLDARGDLCDKASGEILMAAPSAYQIGDHKDRRLLPSRFRILAADRAAFQVDGTDPSRTLVIDPILSYATYLGGSGRDTIVGIERGPDGSIYVAGNTTSVDLPQAVSLNSPLIRPMSLPLEDTFVVCYSSDGSTLAYAVYVGGDAQDLATSLAVDSQGRATVAGYSQSDNFPTTPGALSQTPLGRDAFAYRLSADGSTLEYSTFLKVISPEWGYLAINPLTFLVSVDASGAATVGGTAMTFTAALSSVADTVVGITATSGAFQTKIAGGNDIFLMRLSADGTAVQWATYYGGSHDESLMGMTVDALGDVLIAGTSNSNDLPLAHPFQTAPPTVYATNPTYNGAAAGFFAKFASSGSAITAASYFGGQSNASTLSSVAMDDAGAIYLAGSSPVSAVPGLTEAPPGPPSAYASQSPAVIVKLDSTGTATQYMWAYSFITAGNVKRVRVNGSHGPCILTNFGATPTSPGALPSTGYSGSGFACFADDGKTLQFATMPPAGGSFPITPVDFAIDPGGTLIAAGNNASGLPTTANAPQPTPGGGSNGYVFKIQPENPLPQLYYVNPPLIFTPIGNAATTTLTLLGLNFAPGATVLWNGTPVTFSGLSGYSSATSISGSLSNSALAALPKGDVQIQVSMPGPGGGLSSPVTIKYVNPAPASISITPQVVPVGSSATTFTVSGALTPDCSITWNGVPQTIVSNVPSSFQFTVPASAFSAAGDFVVAASNPAPGGGSATAHVSVTPSGLPAPTVTSSVAVGIGQGGVTQSLSVNFAPDDAVVVWNGSDRPTSRLNSTTLQYILSQNDLQQMGSAQIQIRSGGVLGPAVTAYVGLSVGNAHVRGDPARGLAYFAGAGASGTQGALVAVAVPSGKTVRSLDLGANIQSFFMTDDQAYLWVTTTDGRIRRVSADTFGVDMTATVPGTSTQGSSSANPTAIPVPGTSRTIVAAGSDGVLRIFDGVAQRGFSSGDLYPPAPANLTPIFATADAVWALVGTYGATCMARLTYDYTGFSSFAQTCNNGLNGPWDLAAPEVKTDAGVTYFQSGSETLVWSSPRGGYVDFAKRRIIAQFYEQVSQPGNPYNYVYVSALGIYDLDSEAQLAIVPAAGLLPYGSFVPYGESQALWNASNVLLLVDLP